MSTVFREWLRIGAANYLIGTYPLEAYLAALPTRPAHAATGFNRKAYVATWAIEDDTLYLTTLSAGPFADLFAPQPLPVAASWFNGIISGWYGARRYTGYPSRAFFDDEIVLRITGGKVVNEWRLDLRHVPDQTDDERRLSLPEFLWPAYLREPELPQ